MPLTIPSTLRATARRVPDAEAVKFRDFSCTYAELDAEVDRTARALSSLGLGLGDRLALMATNSDRFIVAFYAALRVGAVFVPINPASAAPEIQYLLSDSGAKFFLYDVALAAKVDAAREGLPSSTTQVLALTAGTADPALDELARAAEPGEFADVPTFSDNSVILYTSGTTGKPKGAYFDHDRTMTVAIGCVASTGQKVGDRFMHVAPLYHAAELCIMLIPGTMIGATHVVLPGFDPDQALETLERENITMMFGVPTHFQYLLMKGLASRDLPLLRTALFGAAPMPESAVVALTQALPHVDLMQLCGQTEAGPGGIYASVAQVKARPDASGRQPTMFCEVAIVDEDGNPAGPGSVGEMLLRGGTIMKGYWNKPEETASTIVDGWLHTGDLARIDADGFITLVDRLKDMIITGGRNVYSVEVESAIAAHPSVVDVAVIAAPHEVYGESILAVCTLAEGQELTLDDLKAFCADRISHYKVPHGLVISAIPRNASGKILKHQLRAQIAGQPTA